MIQVKSTTCLYEKYWIWNQIGDRKVQYTKIPKKNRLKKCLKYQNTIFLPKIPKIIEIPNTKIHPPTFFFKNSMLGEGDFKVRSPFAKNIEYLDLYTSTSPKTDGNSYFQENVKLGKFHPKYTTPT